MSDSGAAPKRPRRHAYSAPSWAAENRVGDVGSKAVLLLLANYADEEYSCYPGQQRLADETEQSVRQVGRQLAYLEALGLITRARRAGGQGHRTSDRFHLQRQIAKKCVGKFAHRSYRYLDRRARMQSPMCGMFAKYRVDAFFKRTLCQGKFMLGN